MMDLSHGPFDADRSARYLRTGVYPEARWGIRPCRCTRSPTRTSTTSWPTSSGSATTSIRESATPPSRSAPVLPPDGPASASLRHGHPRRSSPRRCERVNRQAAASTAARSCSWSTELADDPGSRPGLLATWLAAQPAVRAGQPLHPGDRARGERGRGRDERVPIIGPWTLHPIDSYSLNRLGLLPRLGPRRAGPRHDRVRRAEAGS